jgi:hypothetical protein
MRKLALPILILGLAAVSAAWAADGARDSAPPPASDKAATAPAATLPDAPAPAKPAATTPASTPAPTAATPAIESELAELRSLLHAQAAEIEAQRHELAEMKAKLGTVKDEAVTAATTAATEAATAAAPAATPAAVLPSNAVTAGGGADESPMAIHFKGITLTPGGFTAAETVYRNRALSADINTPLNNLSFIFPGSNQSKISEFNASGRQSRITLKLDGKLASATIGGYFEGDFLGGGSTSNNNESNSYVFRQRQAWGSVALDSGWYFSGGQMWSLVTEDKVGLTNRTPSGGENANVPMTIDAQYTVGFSWARQYGFRIVDSLMDHKLSLGLSVEGAATRFTASNANTNFFIQAPGNPGGLYNIVTDNQAGTISSQNYTLNATPDFVVKAALDPGWGHYEIFGLVRTFRSRIYPCEVALLAPAACAGPPALPVTALASNDTRAGGGGGANLRVPLFNKKVDVGLHALWGDGVGRYGTGSLNDATVRPSGTLAPIQGGQWLGTIEWHATPKLDVYMYGGGEYDRRTFFAEPAGITATNFVGYGIPTINDSGCSSPVESGPTGNLPSAAANCSGQTRAVYEGTIGFWHQIWKGDRGRVQWGLQYSYLELLAWSGSTGAATPAAQFHPTTNDSMFFTSFRYYLP